MVGKKMVRWKVHENQWKFNGFLMKTGNSMKFQWNFNGKNPVIFCKGYVTCKNDCDYSDQIWILTIFALVDNRKGWIYIHVSSSALSVDLNTL